MIDHLQFHEQIRQLEQEQIISRNEKKVLQKVFSEQEKLNKSQIDKTYQSKCKYQIQDYLDILGRSSTKLNDISNNLPISLVENLRESNNISQSKKILQEMRTFNRSLKESYQLHIRNTLPLMNERVSQNELRDVIKSMLNNLLRCDDFSYIVRFGQDIEVYSICNDTKQFIKIDSQTESQLASISENSIVLINQNLYSLLLIFNDTGQKRSFILKIEDIPGVYFIFHQNLIRQSSLGYNFLELANIYSFNDEIIKIGQFFLETINQIQNNSYLTIQIARRIQVLGLSILSCQKYSLIELLVNVLRWNYEVVGLKDSLMILPGQLLIEFKDNPPIRFYVIGMDLSRSEHLEIFQELTTSFNRYLVYIKKCQDRNAYYKCFQRSKEQILFQFNKKGYLQFISHPLSNIWKDRMRIYLDYENLVFHEIFGDNEQLLQDIETQFVSSTIGDKQIFNQHETENSYEIFMNDEDQIFKGFAILFQKESSSWLKTSQISLNTETNLAIENYLEEDIQKKIRKTRVTHEAINYIDKLEKANPDMINSVVSMFMPIKRSSRKVTLSDSSSKITVVEKTKSSENPKNNNITQMNKNLIFRRLVSGSAQSSPKSSKIFKHNDLETMDIKLRFKIGSLSVEDKQSCLEDDAVDKTSFDILQLENQSEKHRTVWSIMQRNNYFEAYKIQQDKFMDFLIALEFRYNECKNSFHNYDHGVQVMQSVHAILLIQQNERNILDSFTRFVLVFAALCHDVGHTGRTNMYEINSYSKLAITYHDKSVLEQHHIATTVHILRDEKTNILNAMSDEKFRLFRRKLTQNILYTDMTEHFKLMNDFEIQYYEKGKDFGKDEDDIKLNCAMVIHSADFNGAAKKYPASRHWSEKVNKEFCLQYQQESLNGYSQLPYMKDLHKLEVMAKSEISFIKVIVQPLYQMLNKFLNGALSDCVTNLDESCQKWEQIMKKEDEEKNSKK